MKYKFKEKNKHSENYSFIITENGHTMFPHDIVKELSDKEILLKQNRELKKLLELTLAKIWDCKYEEDKIYLIIDHAVKMSPRYLLEKYKKELGY